MENDDHFHSEDTVDPDAFVQRAHRQPMDDSDDDQFEHGEESAARDDDPSDYSVQQFLGAEDGREGRGDSDEGAAAAVARRQALKNGDHFHSEDTVDHNALIQQARRQPVDDSDDDQLEHGEESAARDDDPSDYSVQQFLGAEDAREGSGDSDDGAAAAVARRQALKNDDHFNSEDTVDRNALIQRARRQPMDDSDDDQLQHGEESASSEDNPSDYSVQQFLGRESGSGDADGGAT